MWDLVVYGLMECPIMWGLSVRNRAVYGLMECPISVIAQGRGARSEVEGLNANVQAVVS